MPAPRSTKRGFFQRLFGKAATNPPVVGDCWRYDAEAQRIHVDLALVPELNQPSGAVRLEGESLPARVLLVHGEDGAFHAFCSQCTHGGRNLDPVPGTDTLQCCSLGKSTFGYDGKPQFGPGKDSIRVFHVEQDEPGKLCVHLT